MYAYLRDVGIDIDWTFQAPDFTATNGSARVCIEEVTATPTEGVVTQSFEEALRQFALEEFLKRLEHGHPIKLGSPLYSKYQRRSGRPGVEPVVGLYVPIWRAFQKRAVANVSTVDPAKSAGPRASRKRRGPAR